MPGQSVLAPLHKWVLAGGVLLAFSEASVAQTQGQALTAAEVFAKNQASIVVVETPTGLGSGVVVGGDGLIVTNFHVVEGASKASVKLANGDVYDTVRVAAVDQRRDLILLRVAGFGLPAAQIGDSEAAKVGESVYAIGAPKGLELSISDGIVSAIRNSDDGYRVLQTTAAISNGSSGGGLFDTRGMLIGVTTFKIRGGENLNFALPSNYVRGLMALSDVTMSLDEMNNRYPAQDQARSASASAPLLYPRLAVSYRAASSGARMLVNQMGETATITLYNANAQQIGNALVTWNGSAFVGTAEIRYVCGPVDTRTTVVKSTIEFHVSDGGVLRERYARPFGLNCSRGQVKEFRWGEDSWWP
jgi:hypothetical protein